MAEIKKISTELQLLDKFLDTSGDAGTSGQVLTSTGTGINWVSGGSLPGGPYLPLSGGTLTGDITLDDGSGASPSIYLKNGDDNFWRIFNGSNLDLTFRVGTVTKFSIDNSGNGTFAGNISFGDSHFIGDDADDNLLIQGSASENVIIRSEDGLYFRTGGNNTRLSINSSGNATFAGSVTLNGAAGHINLDSNNAAIFDNSNNNNAYYIRNGGTNSATLQIGTGSSPGSNIKLTLDGSGNVGIGDTSPTSISANTFSLSVNSSRTDLSGALVSKANGTVKHQQYWDSTGYGFNLSANSGNFKFTGGNVGIGTTSPDVKLHIVGDGDRLEISSADYDLIKMGAYGDSGADLDNGFLNLSLDGSEKIRLLANGTSYFNGGNVGIGTTSPNAKLNVNGNIKIEGTNSLFFGGSASVPSWAINSSGNDLIINDQATTSGDVLFTNDGNVGIGTTSPTNKLHIQGSQATVYSSTDSGGQASAGTTINNTNTAGNTNNFSQLLFTVGTNNNSVSRIVAIRSGSDASDLAFVGKSAAGVAEYMRIKSGGNVGIGTTSPGSSLEVLKSASSTTISEARISSLVTSGYGGQANLWLRTSNYGNAMLAFGNQVGSSTVASSASGKISYNTFTRVFTVTADSNALLTLGGSLDRVGINQTSPLYTLDVTGNGRFTSTVTATNFINSSDERLKENIEEVCNNNVEVNWKTFNFKAEKEQKRYGVIAQELEKTNPEFVREDSKGFKSVAYIDLLIAKIAELEARIQKLEK